MSKNKKIIDYVNDTWDEATVADITLHGKVVQVIRDIDEIAKRFMYIKVAYYVDNYGAYKKGRRYTIQVKVFKNFFKDLIEVYEGDKLEITGVLSGVNSPAGVRHYILPHSIKNLTINKTFTRLDNPLDLSEENENKKTYYHVEKIQTKKKQKMQDKKGEFKLDVDI